MTSVLKALIGFAFFFSFAYTVAALAYALTAPTWLAVLVGLAAAGGVTWWITRIEVEEE